MKHGVRKMVCMSLLFSLSPFLYARVRGHEHTKASICTCSNCAHSCRHEHPPGHCVGQCMTLCSIFTTHRTQFPHARVRRHEHSPGHCGGQRARQGPACVPHSAAAHCGHLCQGGAGRRGCADPGACTVQVRGSAGGPPHAKVVHGSAHEEPTCQKGGCLVWCVQLARVCPTHVCPVSCVQPALRGMLVAA